MQQMVQQVVNGLPELTSDTTLIPTLADIESTVGRDSVTQCEPRMMESPKQLDKTAGERSRDPSPDSSQSEPDSEGPERMKIHDLGEYRRYTGTIEKIEAPHITVDQLIEACGEAEREVNAYQEKVNAYQAGLQGSAPVQPLRSLCDGDSGLAVLEGHMAHGASAEGILAR